MNAYWVWKIFIILSVPQFLWGAEKKESCEESVKGRRPGVSFLHDLKNEDYSDLESIGKLLDKAKVMALGESHHGTEEPTTLRVKIVKNLIQNHGVRAIGFETFFDLAEAANEFVYARRKHPVGLWWGRAIFDLQEFIRDFNLKNPHDPVKIFGFDTRDYNGNAGYKLTELLNQPSLLPFRQEFIQNCKGYDGRTAFSPLRTTLCLQCLKKLQKSLQRMNATDIVLDAIVFSKIMYWHLAKLNADSSGGWNINPRDAGMADLFVTRWNFLAPGKKAIIWAHNSHVAKKRSQIITLIKHPIHMMTKREPASMGEYLAQSLGNEYIALAGIGYDVSAKQPRMENGTFVRSEMSFTAALNSIAYRLHALNNPLQFIEIKNSVFRSDRPQFETGGENFYLQYIPREQYDGFLFVDTIRATNLPID